MTGTESLIKQLADFENYMKDSLESIMHIENNIIYMDNEIESIKCSITVDEQYYAIEKVERKLDIQRMLQIVQDEIRIKINCKIFFV